MKRKGGFRYIPLAMAAVIAFLVSTEAYSQSREKRLSKKELQEEVNRLRYMVDSLMLITSDTAEAIDDADSLNPGELGFFNSEFFDNPNPGENVDSLLSQWYNRRSTFSYDDIYDAEVAEYTSSIPDSVYIRKIKRLNSYIPIPYNHVVRNHIILYTEKMPTFSSKVLALGEYYLPIFEEIFDKYGLPKELKAMAIIESGFNPVARSRAKAMGMWQFMYRTGKFYGLTINSFVDERLDPIKACDAAARYLRDSYIVFGDWALAISSYNCGSGNVLKAIRRCGGSTAFWDLYPYLPRETRGYVPAFVGALYLLKYYKDYNLKPMAPYTMPAQVDTFEVKKNLHFGQISELVGIPMETLRILNPQYIKDIIPGNERTYILTIPHQYTAAYVDHEKEVYTYKDSVYFNPIVYANMRNASSYDDGSSITHKVKRGETLGKIAKKYGVTSKQIMKWNHLKSANKLRVGQRLVIYRNGGPSKGSSASTKQSSPAAAQTTSQTATAASANNDVTNNSVSSDAEANEQATAVQHEKEKEGPVYYKVRKGDTLSKIAAKHNISLSKLLKLNKMTTKTKIYPGNKIRVK